MQENSQSSYRYATQGLFWLLVGFVIYGSLFPFNFLATPRPFVTLFQEWQPFQNRADAVDNFLLFLPLGIVIPACWRQRSVQFLVSTLVILLLGLGLQACQLYLPGRVASLADMFWNTCGLMGGLYLARFAHKYLAELPRYHELRLFPLCLALLWFCYESFPFLPTLDISLLRAHLKPFVHAPPFEGLRFTQHFLSAMLGYCALQQSNLLKPGKFLLFSCTFVLFFFEIFAAYGGLRRETLLGILLGIGAAHFLTTYLEDRIRYAVLLIAISAYVLLSVTPLRALAVQATQASFTLTPFSHALWYGLTKDIPPTAYQALSIGGLLWAGFSSRQALRKHPVIWASIVLSFLVLCEAVRIFIVQYAGDTTPLVLFAVLVPLAWPNPHKQAKQPRTKPISIHTQSTHTPSIVGSSLQDGVFAPSVWKSPWIHFLCTWLCLSIGLYGITRLPGIPYNVGELFHSPRLIGAAFFALALLWIGAGTYYAHQKFLTMKHAWWRIPFILIALSCVSLVLLQAAVTQESLDDITGATDLYRRITTENIWGEVWQTRVQLFSSNLFSAIERLVRYTALYSLPLIAILCGLSIASPIRVKRPQRMPHSANVTTLNTLGLLGRKLSLLVCACVAKLIVIDYAITDNLIELLTPYGVVYLGALLLLYGYHTTLLAMHLHKRWVWLFSCVSLVISWWLFNQGIEHTILKDGKVFSGVQFLLGANRHSALSESALFLRWCIIYSAGAGISALGIFFAMRLPYATAKKTKHTKTNAPTQ